MAGKVVHRVLEGLYFIESREGFIPDSNIFLVETGERFVLFDAGIQNFYQETKEAIEGLGFSMGQLDRVILTHTHLDHSGSIPLILEDARDAELWVSVQEADYLERGDDTVVLARLLGQRLPPLTVHRKLREGEVIRVGRFAFQVLHTPGHSIGSLCFYEPSHCILISGDVVFRHGSFGRVDFPTGDAQQLKQSIARLAQLSVEILLPGHMDIAVRNASREIQLALQMVQYI